jgi:phospholipase C
MKKLFNFKSFLNKRDAWAGTFEDVYSQRTAPRTDCPTTLPSPPVLRQLPLNGNRPLSDLQLELLEIAASVTGQKYDITH